MVQLQAGNKRIDKAGAELLAVSYDSVATLAKVKKGLKISYPLLSDKGSKTINAYKVRNKELDGGSREGLAKPVIFIIGRDGKITSTLAFDGYRKRYGVKDIVKALK